jgi:hypothetical protein
MREKRDFKLQPFLPFPCVFAVHRNPGGGSNDGGYFVMTWRGRLVWDATSAVNSAATFRTVHVNHRTPVGRTPAHYCIITGFCHQGHGIIAIRGCLRTPYLRPVGFLYLSCALLGLLHAAQAGSRI